LDAAGLRRGLVCSRMLGFGDSKKRSSGTPGDGGGRSTISNPKCYQKNLDYSMLAFSRMPVNEPS
jgi:hypothetical protein